MKAGHKSNCSQLELFSGKSITLGTPQIRHFCGVPSAYEHTEATTRKQGIVADLRDAAAEPTKTRTRTQSQSQSQSRRASSVETQKQQQFLCENEIDHSTCHVDVASGKIQGCVKCVELHKQKLSAGLIPVQYL